MKITGQCFCGSVAYEATIDEQRVGICHCRDCQIFSGSAFRMSCVVEPAGFRFTSGTPRHFSKVADSGKARRMAFCERCGTHLCSMPEDPAEADGYVSIRLSTSNEFHRLRPVVEIFCDSRVPWLTALDGARQFPRMPEKPR